MENEKLILSLIKDDLINTKLVYGLSNIGLTADDYLLNLSETIFELMGIFKNPHHEEIYEAYIRRIGEVSYIEISQSHHGLEVLALDIYNELRSKNLTL